MTQPEKNIQSSELKRKSKFEKVIAIIIVLFSLFLSCSSDIQIDEEKIHAKIKSFYLEVLNDPSTFEIISYSKPDTIFKSENQLKLKIKVVYLHSGKSKTGDFDITVTKDDLIVLPTKEYENFLRD